MYRMLNFTARVMNPTGRRDGDGAGVEPLAAARSALTPRASRRDFRTSKIVYRAQLVRRVFGHRVARLYLLSERVPVGLIRRILACADEQLRR